LDVTFRPYDPVGDEAALVDLLTTETWTYRVKERLEAAEVAEELARGEYHSEVVITLVIERDGRIVGFARAFDLGEDKSDPQLDFRLRAEARGQGLGTEAVRRITDAVFTAHPDKTRIEGQTRADNVAMRRAFLRAGYEQEAVYRQAWPGHDGTVHDGIGYAILRRDWETGTTTPVDWSIP
jgi:RimJ/RimL family protein N-acetyltransferase